MKKLTWNQLADLYDEKNNSGRKARTLKMNTVFAWAERQKELFTVDSEGYIYLKEEK